MTPTSEASASACSPAPCPRAIGRTNEAGRPVPRTWLRTSGGRSHRPHHLATCAWLILERPDIAPEHDLPGLIRRYNESVGGVNDETQGYHETITQGSIIGVRRALARSEGRALVERVNALLEEPEGRRDWLLRFYSRGRLFSTEARQRWVEPDLRELPAPTDPPV